MRVNILGSPVDVLTMDETVNRIDASISRGQQLHHVVVNAAKLVAMQKDRKLYNSVVSCDLINADGQSVVWASRFLNNPLPERVAGIDLMFRLFELSATRGYKVFLFGAKEEVVCKVVTYLKDKYGEFIVAGWRNGYYTPEDELEIAQQIGDSGAHMLFVAISSPKKEIFLNRYKHFIKIPFIMGVGGSFDIVAGKTRRAPLWMQKFGLEWLYRLLQEPGRMWKRYLITNTLFLVMVVREKMMQMIVRA
jgi:N-acetylglucosaminyldiphosphoundecaprenol N-acetyl-beta-D-mannosaminyltransferase